MRLKQILLMGALCSILSVSTQGEILLTLQPSHQVILPGEMGFIDVVAVVTGDDLDPIPGVAAYNVRLDVTPMDLGGKFKLDAVVQGPQPLFPNGDPNVFASSNDNLLRVADDLPSSDPEEDLDNGDVLFRFFFEVEPGTSQSVFHVEFNSNETFLTNSAGNLVNIDGFHGATITPEPSSLLAFAVGTITLMGRRRLRRKA